MKRNRISIKRKYACLLTAIICCGISYQQAYAMPNIVHQPPLEVMQGRSLSINATITDPGSSLIQVRLFFRISGTLGYRVQVMTAAGYNYKGQIPGAIVLSKGVQYYIEARNQAGEIRTSPVLNAAHAPHQVVVRKAASAPVVRLLAPEEGAWLTPQEAVMVVAIDAGRSRPDLSTLKVILDGQDVTNQARISETMISFVPPKDLSEGEHKFQVKVRNLDGVEAEAAARSFIVSRSGKPEARAEKRKEELAKAPRQFVGSLGTEVQYAALTREPGSTLYLNRPAGWLNRLNLNWAGKAGELNMLGAIFLTDEETPGQQPVNRFSLEIFDKSFNFTAGDIYPVFSDYSISNIFLRGGSLALTSGRTDKAYSKFQVLGGMTRIPIEGRSDAGGTFEQWLWGTQWFYNFLPGTGFSLNFSTINDYANSIDEDGGSLPANNHLATSEGRVKINLAPRFATTFYGEYGLSYYDESQNLLSLSLGEAFRGGTRWEWGNRNSMDIQYRHTGANYVSLANDWLIGDWEGLAGDAQVYLLHDTLALLANAEIWSDNLDGQKTQTYLDAAGTSVTAGTTRTTYFSGMINYAVSNLIPNLSAGYSFNSQQDDSQPSSVINNQTSVLNLRVGIQLALDSDQVLTNINLSQTQYRDLAQDKLSADMDFLSFQCSLIYLRGRDWSFTGGYGLTRNMGDYTGVTLTAVSTSPLVEKQTIDYHSTNLQANWKAWPGKLDLGLGWENLSGKDDADLVGNNLSTISLSSTYYFTAVQSLSLNLMNIAYSDRISDINSYGEFVTNLRYGLNF